MTVEQKTEYDESFNWLAVLKDLAAGARFTDEQSRDLAHRAANWPTCACGQLCETLPQHGDGGPQDRVLRDLGIEFFYYIEIERWDKALTTFYQIEVRSQQLLDAMEADRCPF